MFNYKLNYISGANAFILFISFQSVKNKFLRHVFTDNTPNRQCIKCKRIYIYFKEFSKMTEKSSAQF